MTFNPYAAPQPFLGEPPPGGGNSPRPWTIDDVLRAGWEATKTQWPVLIFAPVVAKLLSAAPPQAVKLLAAQSEDGTLPLVMTVAGNVAGALVGTFFSGGLITISLAAARGQPARIADLFAGGPVFLRLLGASFLSFFAVLGGLLLLVVPGILVMLGLSMTNFYIVDAGMGPVAAMRASWRAMNGHKAQLFLFGVVSMLLLFVGLFACCVGVLVANAVVQTALAVIYLRVSGRGV